MSVTTLALGDRLALIRKLLGLIGNLDPAWLDRIAEIVGLFGGNAASFKAILDVVKKVLEFFKKPTTSAVTGDVLADEIADLCKCGGIELHEFDGVLKILAN